MIRHARLAPRTRGLLVTAALFFLGVPNHSQSPGLPLSLPGDTPDPPIRCGTTTQRNLMGIQPEAVPGGLPDGEPLFFDQDPPLVFADHVGPIILRGFSVIGDFASVQFLRDDSDRPEGRTETWHRINSRSINGQLISIFEPSWPDTELATSLEHRTFGFDRPFLYWGAYQIPGSTDVRNVYLRMGLTGIPSSRVTQINDRVQYSSSVVNLVVPGFGDSRIYGSKTFELSQASLLFYQHFSDTYDVLGFTPQSTIVADYGAFHQNVRNGVSGLNLPVFDNSNAYGSAGILKGAELYAGSTAARYEDTNHEMAHQWGSHFDWTRIAGIARAGWNPSSHAPLWTGGETLIGAVLTGDRRGRTMSNSYQIEVTPAPTRYHPIEKYSMGVIGPEQVPDFAVFLEQDQFDPDSSASPASGVKVKGDVRQVVISDVIREHGPRSGPGFSEWRRAAVLVSRDRLATQREMDYWNFFAQRLGDRNRTARPTRLGFGSFRQATDNAMTLSTAIRPIGTSALPEELDVDTPVFGPTDWRGVTFSQPVPSRFSVDQVTTLSGRVTALDPVDFNSIGITFSKVDGSEPVRFYGDVRRSGDFTVSIRFAVSQRGQYAAGVALFWPGSGSQFSRTYLSTVTVE